MSNLDQIVTLSFDSQFFIQQALYERGFQDGKLEALSLECNQTPHLISMDNFSQAQLVSFETGDYHYSEYYNRGYRTGAQFQFKNN